MATDTTRQERVTTEEDALELVEESRQETWEGRACIKEMFEGSFPADLVFPFPTEGERRPEFVTFYEGMKEILETKCDPVEIDATGEYPEELLDALREIGAFGMKVPTSYGGLGLSQVEYGAVMEMLGSYDSNVCALLSAHQSIGVPRPLMLFGTDELKDKYLPRCAKGAISAFALTEPAVGSDPSAMSTSFEVDENGDYILNGEKLWCTNGTLADLLVVMARDASSEKNRISAFIVEAGWEGVEVAHRCRFMGLRALANGVIGFKNVRIPKANLIGTQGRGLKIALETLNAGRLSIPAGCAGAAKQMLEICQHWSNERASMGVTIGKHEAIATRVADMAATTFAMDSIADLANQMADRGGYDIRLEAACVKEWNTVRFWEIVDEALQIRGGRGYETEESLKGRGETPIAVERIMRDARINLVFEGSSEIMHLFMAREAVDLHLTLAGALINPKATMGDKLKVVPGMLGFYAKWYPDAVDQGAHDPREVR